MGFDYQALNTETVQPLIDEFGKLGQLSVNVPDSGNEPYENQIGEPDLYPVSLVQTVFKKSDNNGTTIEVGDVLYIISTKGVTIDPELADRIIVDGASYQVVRVDPLKPGPVIMLWKVHARK